jgi:translation initiation factor 2 subunit 2
MKASVMKSYKELLKRAQAKLPKERGTGERFEIPKVRSSVVGMRTIIHNFKEVADVLNRDPRHLMKFLTNEMATAGTLEETRATFQGKFPHNTLERLVSIYTENFVICPVCKRPDTKIVKERRLFFLICEACGAKSSVKAV